MNKYIYADNGATTMMTPNVIQKMIPYLKYNYGNASSIYKLGKKSNLAISNARRDIAKILNVNEEEIYFTSSGTEADNIAILGFARKNKNKGKHIITSKFEHLAVLNSCKELEKEGLEVTYVDVEENGIIDVEKIKNEIRDDTILISIMFVNNEIGTIQDVYEIAKIAREKNIIFHTDAVQAIPHLKIDASKFDAMSISAHKFNGPKGIGILYVKNNVQIEPIMYGGHQENSLRPSTENVAGIVGAAEALTETQSILEVSNRYEKKLRDYLYEKIRENIDGVVLNGELENRIPSNLNISIEGIETSELMVFLDMNNICVSTGSACNSGKLEPSYVIKALGKNSSSLRITISRFNTISEMNIITKVLKESVENIKSGKNKKN